MKPRDVETPDHSNKLFYLLAAGALLVMLAGGLTGMAKRSSPVPPEDITNKRLLELFELNLAPGSDKEPPAVIPASMSEERLFPLR
jgi:hypothetical protein